MGRTQLLCKAGVTRQQADHLSLLALTSFWCPVFMFTERENEEGDVVPHRLHVSRDQKLASYDRASLKSRPLTSVSTITPSRRTTCQKQAGSKGRPNSIPKLGPSGMATHDLPEMGDKFSWLYRLGNSSVSHSIWFLVRLRFSYKIVKLSFTASLGCCETLKFSEWCIVIYSVHFFSRRTTLTLHYG